MLALFERLQKITEHVIYYKNFVIIKKFNEKIKKVLTESNNYNNSFKHKKKGVFNEI
jgi:hypothetical protein